MRVEVLRGSSAGVNGRTLKALGVTIANSELDESTHKDRKLLTGVGPLAANALGKLVAETLLAQV